MNADTFPGNYVHPPQLYTVAQGCSPDDLSRQVNALIAEGWTPIGGVSAHQASFCNLDSDGDIPIPSFIQALIRTP
jgi:hypothetical protein